MKQLATLLFLLCNCILRAQVVLSSQPLELKKSLAYHEITTAPNAANTQLTVFAADKERVKAMYYNSAVFFRDSLSTSRPDTDYKFVAGYSYEGNNPTAYWASGNYKKIQGITFNFEDKTVSSTSLELDYNEEQLLTTFNSNNAFYIITLHPKEDILKLYTFTKGNYEVKLLDFSGYTFTDITGKEIKFNDIIQEYGLQHIETRGFNDLYATKGKVKLYTENNSFILTLDYNAVTTQVLTINLTDYTLTEKFFPQPALQEGAQSASYYNNNTLYQLKLNRDELALSATDFTTSQNLKTYTAVKSDSISFKNSPLLSQTGSNKPRLFKDTRRFLRKAAGTDVALAVYSTPDIDLVTVGGTQFSASAGTIAIGVVLGGAMIATGNGYSDFGLFDSAEVQTVYFEGFYSPGFEHLPNQGITPAADFISEFMAVNKKNISLQTVTPFNDYYILGYYDEKAKQYILRKFEDGY